MTEHEAWVRLYGILERSWVPYCPAGDPDKNCLMTGVGHAVSGERPRARAWTIDEEALVAVMQRRLKGATKVQSLDDIAGWSDSHTKAEVLAVVAECIWQTAPPPMDLHFTDILEETEALS